MMRGNMNNMMRQVQKMQKQMAEEQEKLKDEVVEGTAGGEAVKVKTNGHKQVVDVTINPEVVDPEDVEMLQDLVLAAVNDALTKADELANQRLGKFTKGLNLPGF
ncbi:MULTISPECIES: YbaB/EbfC family nucleoid-associated protein [unclassified Sporolactobacillus]|uniref:YbaB/EbfC family nucleoid-associated protein n=1 Tax=unclassified Sporolactobacillus TaxID=2628533 RepID=UPI002368926B|nr:YbaB/EbfC family nucleoid-associated protein [Sporolactobacillus sp. CQH2019]MDD9150876.1 YbaB/EbfC family nucleoid-associated protein [Sporolactobacillus sp. CQH2019]